MARTEAATWFDERVRQLVRYPTGDGAEWIALDRVVEPAALERIEQTQRRGAGAPAKVALTTAAGWTAGYVTAALAVGLLRDGVLVRLSEASAAAVLRDAGGWLADVRFEDAPREVAAGHPLAGAPGVAVVDDPAAGFGAEVAAVCGPWITALAARSRRSANGLWAMAADAVGTVTGTIAGADDTRSAEAWIAAADALLAGPGTPWRKTPTIWAVETAAGDPAVVQHRTSCCLWYRCDPDDADDPAAARAEITEVPNYCSTCLFRDRGDIDARARAAG